MTQGINNPTFAKEIKMDEHISNVIALFVFFAIAGLAAYAIKESGKIGRRSIKAGDVITNKIPPESLPEIPRWANAIMEHRISGKYQPAQIGNNEIYTMFG